MKVRLFVNQFRTDGTALEYIRLAKNVSPRQTKGIDESHTREAQEILESVREQDNSGYELDIDITGKNLIDQMDSDLEDMGLVPYHFSKAAAEAGEAISVGSHVSIPHDDRRFSTLAVSRRKASVRLRDGAGNEYVVPWQLPRPWRE